jgi:formate hydrogenlyase subunit 3/multisubunit Na+/H+ antiporter MnhD subunit
MPTDRDSAPVWVLVAGVTVLLGLSVGWFLLSWRVLHATPGDAAGEALGVAFGLLIVASVIGAIRKRDNSDG